MAISKRRRFEIFKRDRFACLYCGRKPPEVLLEADHIVPISKGGLNTDSNLATSCQDCNRGKSDVGLSFVPKPIGNRLNERREMLDQLKGATDLAVEENKFWDTQFRMVSDRWVRLEGRDPKAWVLTGQAEAAVRKFLKRLPFSEVLDALEVANDFHPGRINCRYFCGVCWKKVRSREGDSVLSTPAPSPAPPSSHTQIQKQR